MALLSETIASLINGVSQQPPSLRLPSQAELQVNALSSVVEGMRKRPALRYHSKISGEQLGDVHIHTINRDASERYELILGNGTCQVEGLDGISRTVNFPDGADYLTAETPSEDFKTVTIADYTFVVNTTKSPAMSTDVRAPGRVPQAIVFVRQAAYEKDYSIILGGATATYTTGATGQISTDRIATNLRNRINAIQPGVWTVRDEGHVLWLWRNDGADFQIEVRDGSGGDFLSVFTDTVQRFSELPTTSPDGYIVEVAGDNTSNFDNYYVRFETSSGSEMGNGVWRESSAPDVKIRLDGSTMPHGLIREADGSFTFRRLEWSERVCGDEDSAPDPAFVGRKINDVFLFKNRLGFLADEDAVMSEVSEFFNFFPTTVTTVVDSDPVTTAASHTKVSILRHAVPFNGELLLFSDQTQFSLPNDDIKASDPPALGALTEYESSLLAKPVGSGRTVFFVIKKGDYSGIREYFVLPDTEVSEAADVTGHVPAYLPKEVHKLAASSNEGTLLALSRRDRGKIWIYRSYWSGEEKLQSAWSHFTVPQGGSVLNVDFIDTTAYVVIQYPEGVFIETLDFAPEAADPDSDFEFALDRRIDESQIVGRTYDATTGTTRFDLPYAVSGDMVVVERFAPGQQTEAPGRILQKVGQSGSSVEVRGNHTATPVYIGARYEMRYRFSQQDIKEQAPGGGRVSIKDGRLQLLRWIVSFSRTGAFRVEVKARGRDLKTYPFSGKILGKAVLGEIPISSGDFKFSVMSKNDQVSIDLVNDGVLPSRFTAAGWEGRFTLRSSRR